MNMVQLSRDEIVALANLAQIELSDAEIKQYQKELSQILEYFEQLKAVDVSNLEPTNQVTGLVDVTRPDSEYKYPLDKKIMFNDVPEMLDQQIKVKKVL